MAPTDVIFIGLLGLLLVPVCMIDLRERRIPNGLNLAIGFLGLAHAVLRAPSWHTLWLDLGTMAVSALLFGGTAWVMSRVSKHSRIGTGDLKFLVAASLWVGWDGSVVILFIACICAVLATLFAAPWRGMDIRRLQPFGPMLAIGMILVVTLVFHGQALSEAQNPSASGNHAGTVSAASKPTNT